MNHIWADQTDVSAEPKPLQATNLFRQGCFCAGRLDLNALCVETNDFIRTVTDVAAGRQSAIQMSPSAPSPSVAPSTIDSADVAASASSDTARDGAEEPNADSRRPELEIGAGADQ